VISREEGGDDVKSHGPYGLGYTRATMAVTMGANGATFAISKSRLSSDWALQLEP